MNHFTDSSFWKCYDALPEPIQRLAKKNFELLKLSPEHPSLKLKKVGELVSVRVGVRYRAVAREVNGNLVWNWIGTHSEYDKLLTK